MENHQRALTRAQLMQRIGQPVACLNLWNGNWYGKVFDGNLAGYHKTWLAFDERGYPNV